MANVITVKIKGPVTAAQLLDAEVYGANAIIRLQSATSPSGTFANVTTEPLVTGIAEYTLGDTAGTSTTWYRSRYENAAGTNISDWSVPETVTP